MKRVKVNTRLFIGFIVITGFFALLGVLIFAKIPDENKQILLLMTGYLGSEFGSIISYYFGKSEPAGG